MSEDEASLQSEIDELLKDVKEKEKKSYEFKRAAERQLSYAMSGYIAPPDPPKEDIDKEKNDKSVTNEKSPQL